MKNKKEQLMEFKNKSDYQSSWEWTKAHSKYHFDNTKKDQWGEWARSLGRFEGDWKSEVDDAVEKSKNWTVTWANRKFWRNEKDKVSDMLEQEHYDLESTGVSKDLEMSNRYDFVEEYPTLKKMCEYFAMEDEYHKPWIHVQMPGQMFNLHIDKFWDKLKDTDKPNAMSRIVIMLEDWQPGQFYLYGTYTYSHWRAGDIHVFDWPNVPHATANASKFPRPTLVVTGFNSARTDEILKNSNDSTIHKI